MTSSRSTSILPAGSAPIDLTAGALEFIKASKAANSERAYRAAWLDFETYCRTRRQRALPASPAVVANYLDFLARGGLKVSTLEVRRAAIRMRHLTAGQADPTADVVVKTTLQGIRRKAGTRPDKKAPLLMDDLRRMVAGFPDSLTGRRDKALLLIGFAGAFRRSELAGLDVSDVVFGRSAIAVRLRRSKTDQEGKGATKTIPLLSAPFADVCPVRALRAWLDASGIQAGPVWRKVDRWGHVYPHNRPAREGDHLNDHAVALIVKQALKRLGLSGQEIARYAGHSLRSGFITQAALDKVDERSIQQQTGHRSLTTLRGYIQDAGAGAQDAVKTIFERESDH